ncbi:hypothetical protein GCM10027563_10540 [Parasphingorhabdus pacifica]
MKGEAFRTAAARPQTVLALLILVIGVLLSGCLHTRATLNLTENDTASGEILLSTQTPDGQVPFRLRPPEGLADRVNVTPYSKEGRTGSRLTFQKLTYDEVEKLASEVSQGHRRYTFDLHRSGSLVLFNGSVDLTPLEENSSSFLLEISTPGEVTTTNGHESAGVVSWRPEAGQVTELSAAFQFAGAGSKYWIWWTLLVVALSFGAAGFVAYLAQRAHHEHHHPKASSAQRPEESIST